MPDSVQRATDSGPTSRDTSKYELNLIGGFAVRDRGVPVAIPSCCERMVAYLAIAAAPVERVRLAGVLWLDKSETRARANLRSALWRLRGAGANLLDDSGPRIGLRDGVRVDVAEHEEWAQRLRTNPRQQDLDTQVRHIGADLLPDWYDDWVLMERERYRQRTLHAIDALIKQLVHCRRFAEAIDAGHGAIAIEPLRESSHRAVIMAHVAEGNRGEAMRHVDMCSDLFRKELDLEVRPELEHMLAAVVAVA